MSQTPKSLKNLEGFLVSLVAAFVQKNIESSISSI